MRTCTKCLIAKESAYFYKYARGPGGLQTQCKSCIAAKQKERYLRKAGHIKAVTKAYAKANPVKTAAWGKKYREANKDRVRQLGVTWAKANVDKCRAKVARWRSRNRAKIRRYARGYVAFRQAQKIKATPPWLTVEQKQQIRDIYLGCPPGHDVDHIHPLRGETVCGLHVPWNLQYLPHLENIQKSNKLLVEYL